MGKPTEAFLLRPPKDFPAGTAERMQVLLQQAKTVADQRRIQAVLMRALEALPPVRIAALTGLSVHTVRVIHSRFLREGEAWLTGRPGRGGRRRTLLSDAQAGELLARHAAAAGQGVTDHFKTSQCGSLQNQPLWRWFFVRV